MQMACRIVQGWCTETGLSVNPTKTELVLFSRRRKLEGFRAPTMYGRPLALSREVKYLGVILDSKLTWRSHVDRLVSRSTATFWKLRRAVGRTWGLNPNILQWIYTAIIRPRIQYGSVVWWPCVQKSIVARSLGRIQRLACMGITEAMRTTPTAALEILLGLPTVPSWIRMTAMAAHLRMRDSGNWQVGGEVVGHARIARLAEEALPISAYRVVEANHLSRLDKSFTLTIPNIEMWKRGEIQFPEEALVCYTDGSRLASGQASGAGMYVENRGVLESYSQGTNTTIFEAEVYAILSAACNEEVRKGMERKVYICSDSQAALKAICGPRTRTPLVQECAERLEELTRLKEVILMWVPGHMGVPGNEEADRLARLGTRGPFVGPEPAIGLSRQQVTSALKKWVNDTTEEQWRQSEGCQQAKDFIAGLNTSRSAWLRNQGRWAIRNLVGVLTGHCRLRRHLSLLGIEEDSLCMGCGEADETAYHFLAECDLLGGLRYEIFGSLLKVGRHPGLYRKVGKAQQGE
nr:unnamed protein product [Callosobruchus chinensis]